MLIHVRDLYEHDTKKVTLKGWVANKRMGKGLVFIIFRDGTGYVQCVVEKGYVGDKIFRVAEKLTMESSIEIIGKVVRDKKQIGGYELHVSDIKIFQISDLLQ